MPRPFFFGYGSLVNAATHDYPNTQPAHLSGWRRVWRHTGLRKLAFLSVEPCEKTRISGLIAEVPNGDWTALDQREWGYFRQALETEQIAHTQGPRVSVEVYRTRPQNHARPATEHPILLSYIDCVCKGFLDVFGRQGVADFFHSTHGWTAPILDDRAKPCYPRSVILSKEETGLVNQHLAGVQARVTVETT